MSSRLLANALVVLASLAAAVIIGLLVSIGFVSACFNNTRGDGYAIFLISFIVTGLFVNVVAFAWLASRKQAANGYLAAAQAMIWIVLAAYFTRGTCIDYYITWSKLGWILTSNDWQAEVPAYALRWIIRGWLAILSSGLLSVFVSRRIISRSTSESLVPATN